MDKTFEQFEDEVMKQLIEDESPELANMLRKQYNASVIIRRSFSGVGFFTDFEVKDKSLKFKGEENFELGNIGVAMDDVEWDAGFVLFIRDGFITLLEGYTYTDPWPPEVKNYTFHNSSEKNEGE